MKKDPHAKTPCIFSLRKKGVSPVHSFFTTHKADHNSVFLSRTHRAASEWLILVMLPPSSSLLWLWTQRRKNILNSQLVNIAPPWKTNMASSTLISDLVDLSSYIAFFAWAPKVLKSMESGHLISHRDTVFLCPDVLSLFSCIVSRNFAKLAHPQNVTQNVPRGAIMHVGQIFRCPKTRMRCESPSFHSSVQLSWNDSMEGRKQHLTP